jgi:hypothetical protein
MSLSPAAGLCEDDAELRGVVRDVLAREGFAVRVCKIVIAPSSCGGAPGGSA